MKRKSLRLFPLILIFVSGFVLMDVRAPVTLPVISIDPAYNTADPGGAFSVNVNIADVVNLYAWGIKISWEEDLLEATSVTEGPFFAGYPQGTAFVKVIYDDYIDVGCTVQGAWPGRDGSGTLMTVTFDVLDAGKTALDIFYSVPLDSNLDLIAHTVEHGYFETAAAANLVAKSAWPEHHHFDISVQLAKDGNANQSLFGKVRNLGSLSLYVYVSFEIVRDNGAITTLSAVATLGPGVTEDLNATFGPLTELDAGKYYASASVYYSYTGTYWAQGDKIKTFSFAVVP